MSIQQHVVFMNTSDTGHMNPTLSLVAHLYARGCKVSYFVDQSVRSVVEAAGAAWHPFRYPGSDSTSLLQALDEYGIEKYVPRGTPKEEYETPESALIYGAERLLPGLVEDLRSLEPPPSLIIYDPFLAFAQVAAHVLCVPAVATLTMPGPGACAVSDAVKEEQESKPWVEGPRQEILSKYGFDVLKRASLWEFHSPVMNLVTTVNQLYVPPRVGYQTEMFGDCPFKCVGSFADSNVKRIANSGLQNGASNELPLEDIDISLGMGRRLLYISMGTVVTGDTFWNSSLGEYCGKENGLQYCTGKQLSQHVLRACFEALSDQDEFLVILSVGRQIDALEGLPPVPSNFIVRQAVPQLEVLRRCTAFLTHGGANSIHEALSFGVPMVVVPVFGDQPLNADSVSNCGAGIGFRQPLSSVTAATLREAFQQVADASENNPFRAAALDMRTEIQAAGGVSAAVDSILELIPRVDASKGGA